MYPEINLSVLGNSYTFATYSLFAVLSITLGWMLFDAMLRQRNIRWLKRFALFAVICVSFLVGARGLNLLLRWEDYQVMKISYFTMEFKYFSLYGGILMSILVSWAATQVLHLDAWIIYDLAAIPFLLSFSVMKIGCFLNGCCFGKLTKGWFKIPIPLREADSFHAAAEGLPFMKAVAYGVYPTQLMESLGALIIVFILLILPKQPQGYKALWTGILFSALRWFVLNYRILPYSPFVNRFMYPGLYAFLMGLGLYMLNTKKETTS